MRSPAAVRNDVAPITGGAPRADRNLSPHGAHLTSRQRQRAFISMLVLVPLGGAAADIYIPSLPAIAASAAIFG
jgi:hypothetical protein